MKYDRKAAEKAMAAINKQQKELDRRAFLGRCANCGEREGTVRWGDALALTHGWTQMWCKVCALTKQIEHAKERAALIPELEAELAEALGGDGNKGTASYPARGATEEVEG
jgi:hypothetical protein